MIITEEKITQILSYIVHAGNVLVKENHIPTKEYNCAFIPAGPNLYTGTLKAAGYLFLKKTIKTIVYIIQQTIYPNEVVSYGKSDYIIAGRKIKNIQSTKKSIKLSQELFDQLLFARIITSVENVVFLGIGKDTSIIKLKQEIEKHKNDQTCIIYIDKVSNSFSYTKANVEKNISIVRGFLEKKIYKEDLKWLGNLYIKLLPSNKQPVLISYITTNELSNNKKSIDGYMSVVA